MKQELLIQVQNQVQSVIDLFPDPWKPTLMGLRRSLQLWCKSPEQSCTICSSKMFKQTLFFLSKEHGTGPQRGQTLTKGRLAGSSPTALPTYWSWILKKATHQGARAGLLQGENKLGNEGNPSAAPHCLNRTGLVVVMGSTDSPRQGEINSQVQDPPREPSQERKLEMGLWHRSKVHWGHRAGDKATLQGRSRVHPRKPVSKPEQWMDGTGTPITWLRGQLGAQSWAEMGLLDLLARAVSGGPRWTSPKSF